MELKKIALSKLDITKGKVDRVLALEKITQDDLHDFNSLERQYLGEVATEELKHLKGVARDNFLSKIEMIVPANTKSEMWEYNHSRIGNAISNHLREYGSMPLISTIVEETGLSRQTVSKHFKEYKGHPQFTEAMEQFKFMSPRVLASVFKHATSGDMKAARLYFEMIGAISKQKPSSVINGQNNYIQINNTVLSQESLRQLSEDQLNQIENIVRSHAVAAEIV